MSLPNQIDKYTTHSQMNIWASCQYTALINGGTYFPPSPIDNSVQGNDGDNNIMYQNLPAKSAKSTHRNYID